MVEPSWKARAELAEGALARIRRAFVLTIAGNQSDVKRLVLERDEILSAHDDWVVEREKLLESEQTNYRASKPPAKNCLWLMYVTTRPVWEAHVSFDYPLPTVGEEIEIGEERYLVRARTWSLSGQGDVGVGLAIAVSSTSQRSWHRVG